MLDFNQIFFILVHLKTFISLIVVSLFLIKLENN